MEEKLRKYMMSSHVLIDRIDQVLEKVKEYLREKDHKLKILERCRG